jgi:hypothetical protein
MATWTDVSSTVLEPGDPIRSVDIIAIKENIIALSEGADGAPRILTAAIDDSAITAVKLATGTNERNWVLGRTAGASTGAVGTYAFLVQASGTTATIVAGSNYAGSGLRYSGVRKDNDNDNVSLGSGATPSGTWKAMGTQSTTTTNTQRVTLFLRIS